MTLSFKKIRSPEYWITECAVATILSILTAIILYKQIKTRRSRTVIISKSLQITSFLCMLSGFVYCLNICFKYIPYIQWCRISSLIIYTWLNTPIFTGFYQLTRLFYCFSEQKHQTHAQIAYPLYVFVIMALIGFSLLITASIITPYFLATTEFIVPRECGIDAGSMSFSQTFVVHSSASFPVSSRIVWLIANLLYLLWDLTTLLLYVWSIRVLSKKYASQNQLAANKRILSMLYRVLIPTIFYESITFLWLLVWFADRFVFITADTMPVVSSLIVASVYVFAMHLMLDGNSQSYLRFLRVIRALRLHYVCCQWRGIVDEQIEEMKHKVDLQIAANRKTKEVTTTANTTTTMAVTSDHTDDNPSVSTGVVNMAVGDGDHELEMTANSNHGISTASTTSTM